MAREGGFAPCRSGMLRLPGIRLPVVAPAPSHPVNPRRLPSILRSVVRFSEYERAHRARSASVAARR